MSGNKKKGGDGETVALVLLKGTQKYYLKEVDLDLDIADIKERLNSEAGLNVPVKYIKVLIKGKIRDNSETLKAIGIKPGSKVKGKLFFEEGYHQEVSGSITLEKMEAKLLELEKKVNHRVITPEDAAFEVVHLDDSVQKIKGELDESKVNHRVITPEDAAFEVVHLDDSVQKIKGELDESRVKDAEKETRENMLERLKNIKVKMEAIREANRVYT
eukprot:CAMPEP_0204843624 /NCGR_PEP_ID=MMETSP1346-20131115/48086_1 /ASSEMBLY_ACC=CAM_ASM_000771 /TAXON_ID=215587 /ORGANISM="Aplanochytrium stocchinoi, Strain GSBS06" /LENGTH=215 /DNA_ID=CAMNT_0051982793 /DNA_START=233 /DNA_END=880 /DNA_ORIENTATION=+